MNEWTIQELAKHAGVTSRTLRHYDAVGLVPPSRVGANGYRYYDAAALVRLQRVLLLRSLGLGLPAIAQVLAEVQEPVEALSLHLDWLEGERARLGRQIASVRHTIDALAEGGQLMASTMFDGFDHTEHKAEVTARWGADAYAAGDSWWKGLGASGQESFRAEVAALDAGWQAAVAAGDDPEGPAAQALAARHVQWLASVPGVPGAQGAGPGDAAFHEYVRGLADLYVSDARFAAHYGGPAGAAFVRNALLAHLGDR
ncbi:MerR family transcriptional regulator [Herbiconiux liukaitaii]|uniref:MerR family transcriptional regulator n=1 Tax=Herbiconiux liukaitaii TaxID=3342799 RepID=UPI0035BA473D